MPVSWRGARGVNVGMAYMECLGELLPRSCQKAEAHSPDWESHVKTLPQSGHTSEDRGQWYTEANVKHYLWTLLQVP